MVKVYCHAETMPNTCRIVDKGWMWRIYGKSEESPNKVTFCPLVSDVTDPTAGRNPAVLKTPTVSKHRFETPILIQLP